MSNENNGKWTISQNEEYFNEHEYFDTREEAIAFGMDYDDFEGSSFFVGQIKNLDIEADCFGEMIIERIAENHYGKYGECAEYYLDDVQTNHLNILDKMIEETIGSWARQYGYMPEHSEIINVQQIHGRNLFESEV